LLSQESHRQDCLRASGDLGSSGVTNHVCGHPFLFCLPIIN